MGVKRRRGLAGACVLVAVLLLPAASVHAAAAGGAAHRLAADATPLDLASVALGQRDRELVFTLRMRRRVDGTPLGAGTGHVCLTLVQGQGHVVCLDRGAGRWRLKSAGRSVAGHVANPRGGTLVVRLRPADLGLSAGPVRWHVAASADSCADQPAAGPDPSTGGGTPGTGGVPAAASASARPAAVSCSSRAPRAAGATYAGRVWRVVVRGCTARGPAEVLQGPRARQVALTYDDGPSSMTPQFLATLRRLGVPATFFMIGRAVAANPGIAREVLAAGNEIGNHSWDHANLGGGGPAASSEIERTNAAIERATGFTPCLFRPPGRATGADLVARVRALGMTSVLWSADPFDWRLPGTAAIVDRVLAQAGPGGIILDHDGGGPRAQTLAAAPAIIAALRARGYTFVTVSTLLGYRERIALER